MYSTMDKVEFLKGTNVEPRQRSKMQCFAKIAKTLKTLVKCSTLDAWEDSEYTSALF